MQAVSRTSRRRHLSCRLLLGSRAASEFQTRWNGQFIDTDEVSKRGHWEPREGNVCNLYEMLSNQEAIRSIARR
ncbi:hypothetical protein IE4872_CH01903 [Rhizobium gallicum]|uniref:Uncharacterized protein n=1 Tax=Rhizobium gallicum TaxID=56730 RepID=A0A1L5NHY1_9HYPH|nr:hypothetical protein IE4872_CH01903 [Rhizobium gallicum]